MTDVSISSKKPKEKAPVTKPVDVPFWSLREGFVARECIRCGHRGTFMISETMPFQVSSSVVCMACGAITFEIVMEDITPGDVGEILDEGEEIARDLVE